VGTNLFIAQLVYASVGLHTVGAVPLVRWSCLTLWRPLLS